MNWLSVPIFIIPFFPTSTMIAAVWASLEISELTKRFWQHRLQQQASSFRDDIRFTVDLPAGGIANNYVTTGADTK